MKKLLLLILIFLSLVSKSQSFIPISVFRNTAQINSVEMTVYSFDSKDKRTKIFDGYKNVSIKFETYDKISLSSCSFDFGGYFKSNDMSFLSFKAELQNLVTSLSTYTYGFIDELGPNQTIVVLSINTNESDIINSIFVSVINKATKKNLVFSLKGFDYK